MSEDKKIVSNHRRQTQSSHSIVRSLSNRSRFLLVVLLVNSCAILLYVHTSNLLENEKDFYSRTSPQELGLTTAQSEDLQSEGSSTDEVQEKLSEKEPLTERIITTTQNYGTKVFVQRDGSHSKEPCECELISVDCLDSIRCLLDHQNEGSQRYVIAHGVLTRQLIKEGSFFFKDYEGLPYSETPVGKAFQYSTIRAWESLQKGSGLPRRFEAETDHFINSTKYPYCVKHGLKGKQCFFCDFDQDEDLGKLEKEALADYYKILLKTKANNTKIINMDYQVRDMLENKYYKILRKTITNNINMDAIDQVFAMVDENPFMTFAHVARILFNRQPTVRKFYEENLATISPPNNDNSSKRSGPPLRVSIHMRRADSCRHESVDYDDGYQLNASSLDSIAQPTSIRMCYDTSVYVNALRRVKDMVSNQEEMANIHVYLSTDHAGSIIDEIKTRFRDVYDSVTWHHLDYPRNIFDYQEMIESPENVKKAIIGEVSAADLWHLSHGQVFIGHLGSRFGKYGYLLATSRHNTFVPFFTVDGHSICCQIDEQCSTMKPYITSMDDCLAYASDMTDIPVNEDYWEVGTRQRKYHKLRSVGLWGDYEFEYFSGDKVNKKASIANWDYFPKHEKVKTQLVKEPLLSDANVDPSKCEDYLKIDTSPPKQRPPSNGTCNGYDGVLHIRHFDWGGASGTIFFQFMVGFLQWADQHNYLPWFHMDDDFTKPVWDEVVHTQGPGRKFKMMKGVEVGLARDKRDAEYWLFPGKPFLLDTKLKPKTFEVKGTGVWEHYFMPLNDFVPGDPSCEGKPLVEFDTVHIAGLHASAPWAPRAWRYGLVDYVYRPDITFDEWFEPQRKHAAETVKRYIRFNPMIESRARCVFPTPEFSLGMHIRHGDKQGGREIIPPKNFLKYAQAFVENGGGSIFLATDSSLVLNEIHEKWPKHVADRVVHQPDLAGLTSNTTAAFNLGVSPHRTNVEALTDIAVLSKCTFLLHGLSAMSEAAMFINPRLVDGAINLEDEDQQKWKTVKYFIEKMMPREKSMHFKGVAKTGNNAKGPI